MTAAEFQTHNASWQKSNLSPLFLATAFLIIIAAIFGGAGSRYPLTEMIVELATIPALMILLASRFRSHNQPAKFGLKGMRIPILLLISLMLLIMLQIIPLPPMIWHNLPGRDAYLEIAKMAGNDDVWRSWSIDPQASFRSGLSLIVPLTILLAARRLNLGQMRNLAMIFVVMAAVNLLVGLLQTSPGGGKFYPYQTSHAGLPLGFFANRNHSALFMLISLVVSSALFVRAKPLIGGTPQHNSPHAAAIVGMLAAGMFFAFGVLATNSRTVMALLVPTLLILIYLAMPIKYRARGILLALAATGAIIGLFALLAISGRSQIISQLLDRFSQDEDHRFEFWPDSIYAMWNYFPFGSGAGTFETAFRPVESLDIVGTHFVNSAHNEYIEYGVEAGIFGMLLLAIFAIWLIWKMILIIASKSSGTAHWLALHAGFGLLLIAMHSVVDYPLRRLGLMAIAALLVAMVARFNPAGRNGVADIEA